MPLFISSLKQSGHLDRTHITVCIIGSRKISSKDDYGSFGWQWLAPNLTILGVDADPDACDAANSDLEERRINWQEKHLPAALGGSIGESTLYVTKHPMCSSLYPPNEPYIQRFNALPEFSNLDFTVEIETTTLDRLCQQENLESIDFLQIDVQGADLDVLKGGLETLSRGVLAIEIEVEFSPLYIGQPLFGDIDIFLRQQGFTLLQLYPAQRIRRISPVSSYRKGQVLWGDAYYFRDLICDSFPSAFSSLQNPEQILKLACIADILEFTDYALELLCYLTVNYGSDPGYNFADNIVECLQGVPEVVNSGFNNLEIISHIKDFLSPQKRESLQVG